MGIEAKVVRILKWLGVFVVFMAVIMPVQILWLIFFPLLSILVRRRNKEEATELELFTPIDWYGKLVRRFLEPRE